MELKQLKTSGDKQQYRELCKYCFIDRTGWTDWMLTDTHKEDLAAYGAFDAKALKSAIVSKHFIIHLFGSEQRMAGISAVASYPESRNKGYVRAIMRQILEDEREAGRTVSCLYPFSFFYYSKFGYGAMGEYRHVSFSPLDLLPIKNATALVPFDGSRKMYEDLQTVQASYLQGFDFGSLPQWQVLKKFNKELSEGKKKLYLSYGDGKVNGVLGYELQAAKPYASELVIHNIQWTSPEGLWNLMAHLAAHRVQCEKISGDIQQSLPFHLFCAEPRLLTEIHRSWMARPLNLKAILEAKIADEGVKKITPFTFSVEDPMLPQETATYIVSQDGIQKKPNDGMNPIPLPILSALLFGGMTARQAVDAGLCDLWVAVQGDFFAKKRENYLNEHF